MFSQTGVSDLPSTTMPSHPAYLSCAANRPPKLLQVNHSMGYPCGPIPCTSHRDAPGASVPARGVLMMVMTLRGSNPLTFLSRHRSQKIADPCRGHRPRLRTGPCQYCPMERELRSMRSIFPA